MSLLLAKRLSSLFPSFYRRQHHLTLAPPLLRLPFSTQLHEQEEIPFLARYLISSLGFSRDRALKVSTDKKNVGIKSLDQPESVVNFLKGIGLSDTQISAVISVRPDMLSCNVESKLKPKIRELTDAGFSPELLVRLTQYNPSYETPSTTPPLLERISWEL
jgi:mTERF